MVVERRIFGSVNGSDYRSNLEQGERPIFEEEGGRRVYRHPEFSYYPDYPDDKGIIIKSGIRIGLTPRENSIFIVLVENASQVISHEN